jgi:hypothetical protein
MKIVYCLSATKMMTTEISRRDTRDHLSIMIPQIGSTLIIDEKKWLIKEVEYNLDKMEIVIKSNIYVSLIKKLKKEKDDDEYKAMDSYPRNLFGQNTPSVSERLAKLQ